MYHLWKPGAATLRFRLLISKNLKEKERIAAPRYNNE
jgi:hypothetical protein